MGALQNATAQTLQNNALLQIGSGTTLYVQGDFINANTTESDFRNSGTFSITGNWTNDKVVATSSALGKIAFVGSTLQTVSGGNAIYTNDFEINNAAGMTSTNTLLIVNGAATFTNGIFSAPLASSTIVFSASATHSGVKDASHINGYVRISSGRTGAFSFPVGNGTKLQKLDLNIASSSPTNVNVRYVAADAGTGSFATTGSKATPLMGYNTGEYWEVQPSSSLVGSFTAFWDGTNDANASIVPSVRRVARKNGANWLNEGGYGTGTATAGSVTGNSITLSGVTHQIALGWEDIVLPLSWLNVSATDTKDQKVQVQWQVSENSVASYIVERNTGAGFTEIATLASKGNGNNSYSIVDADRNTGSVYYRIKQIDQNGTSTYSEVFDLRIAATGKLAIFPNPVVSKLSVDSEKAQDAKIYNVQGQQVKTLKLQAGRTTVELSDLASGVYFLRTADGGVTKLIKSSK
ncbi:hypothetical protein D3C87_442200 [compost metagenome]